MLAGKGITEIADYEEAIIRRLDRKPVIIGHSFGGLLTMILAGRGLATASIAISPAPFRACSRCRSLHCGQPAWHCAIPRTGTEPSERGPMLIVSADSDHTVPWAIANAAYKKQKRNEGAKRFTSVPVQHDNLRERR